MPKKAPLSQVSDFELRLLKLFKTVAECGSFAAAEGALGISRSAISLHMSDLEKRLGMRLCQRGRAGFALTDEGREVLRSGEAVLAAIEGFRSEVNQMHQQLRGDLNIGIVNNLVTQPKMRITRALKAVRQEGEGVRMRIPRHPATQSALIWPGIPRPSGHLFHGHPAGQSERSDAGVALLV